MTSARAIETQTTQSGVQHESINIGPQTLVCCQPVLSLRVTRTNVSHCECKMLVCRWLCKEEGETRVVWLSGEEGEMRKDCLQTLFNISNPLSNQQQST